MLQYLLKISSKHNALVLTNMSHTLFHARLVFQSFQNAPLLSVRVCHNHPLVCIHVSHVLYFPVLFCSRRVRALANQHGVHMHMDGSRLMEVLPFYGRAASEITGLFDSAVTSFTEGLCALSGAMLMGSAELVADAKLWQTRLGDSAVLPYGWTDSKSRWDAATASDCFRHRFERLTKLVAVLREDMLVMGSVRFTPEVICSCTTHVYMRGAAEDLEAIHEEVCADTGIRIWDHLRGPGFEARFASSDDDPWCYFEWTLGEHNMQIPDDVILDAWAEFGRRLHLWHKARQIKEKAPFLSCKISNANVHSIALNLQGSSINE